MTHPDTEPMLDVLPISRGRLQSVARVALHGLNRPLINHTSTTTYEVLCGSGTIEVDFEVHELTQGSVVTVPAGTPYQDEGDLLLLATSKPPFEQKNVEYLD